MATILEKPYGHDVLDECIEALLKETNKYGGDKKDVTGLRRFFENVADQGRVPVTVYVTMRPKVVTTFLMPATRPEIYDKIYALTLTATQVPELILTELYARPSRTP